MEKTELKVICFGDKASEKMTLIGYFVTGIYDSSSSISLGASYATITRCYHNREISFLIWDVASQEKYKSLNQMYYRGSVAAILVYSLNDPSSFKAIDKYYIDLKENGYRGLNLYLVGNQTDSTKERAVSKEEGETKAKLIDAKYFEINPLIEVQKDIDLFDIIGEDYIVNNTPKKNEEYTNIITDEISSFYYFYQIQPKIPFIPF